MEGKKIYMVRVDDIPDDGKRFCEMTDEEVVEIAFGCYDSIEGFIHDFNADLIDSSCMFAKLI